MTNTTENEKSNELTHLAEFMAKRAVSEIDTAIGCQIEIIGHGHELWSRDCSSGHQYDEYPCDQFEIGLFLGIAWLKTRVEELEKALRKHHDAS